MRNIKYISIILSFLLFPQAGAANRYNEQLIEYSLSVSNKNTDFDFQPGNAYKTNINQLGISWYESFSAYFNAGLEFGYLEMRQIDNSLTAAQFTSGQYAGLRFRFIPFEDSFFSWRLNLNYRYNSTKGTNSNQESQFIWGESTLSNEFAFQITPRFNLFLAGDLRLLDGTQKNSGIVNQTLVFKELKSQSVHFGTKLKVNPNGEIRLEYSSGFEDGVKIHFTRQF